MPAVAAGLLFLPSARFGYVWDELSVVRESLPALVDLRSLLFPPHGIGDFNQYFRPAAYALLRAVLWSAGPDPLAFHVFAVAVHALCSSLVAWLALRLLADTEHPRAGALAAGLVFAVHPAHVEAVAWIGATTESLATAWTLACLLAYDAARRTESGALAALASLFALFAFASKETALLLPAGVAGLEALGYGRRKSQPFDRVAAVRRLAPIAAALAVYLVMRRVSLGGWVTAPEVTDIEAQGISVLPGALLYYLGQLVLPLSSCPFVPQVPAANPGALVLVVAVAALFAVAAYRLWPRSSAACFGGGWMLASLIPPLALAAHTVAAAPVAERYVYSASVGLALIIGCFAAVGSTWLRARQMSVAGLVAVAAWTTSQRLPVFAGHDPFWKAASQCAPHHCLPLVNLADDAQAAHRAEEAESLYRAAIEQPCKPQQMGFAKAHLGVNLYQRGRGEEAQTLWRAALSLSPSYSVPHYMLARTAIERAMASARAGDAAAAQADYGVAEEQLRAAVALRPGDAEYLYAQGQVLYLLGRGEEARRTLRRALEIDPSHPASASARAMLGEPR